MLLGSGGDDQITNEKRRFANLWNKARFTYIKAVSYSISRKEGEGRTSVFRVHSLSLQVNGVRMMLETGTRDFERTTLMWLWNFFFLIHSWGKRVHVCFSVKQFDGQVAFVTSDNTNVWKDACEEHTFLKRLLNVSETYFRRCYGIFTIWHCNVTRGTCWFICYEKIYQWRYKMAVWMVERGKMFCQKYVWRLVKTEQEKGSYMLILIHSVSGLASSQKTANLYYNDT